MLSNSPLGKQAVVLGGGIAGLLAARVLTEHFEHVSLIERDRYPEDPVSRPGVPQGRHAHILLLRGQQILEELFPGVHRDLVARGAIQSDFINDYRFRSAGGWLHRSPSQVRGYVSTRLLLEWQVRQALVKNPQIHIIDGHEVVHIVASNDGKSITGVSLRARPHSGSTQQALTELAADLVVDATGRESKAPQWLKSLGYALPSETIINPFMGYASRVYAPPSDPQRDWKGMAIQANPPRNLRSIIIWPTEEGHWIVGLTGSGKEYPPIDEDAFLEFARGLSDPAAFEALKGAQPLSSVYGYRQTDNRFRHFEHLQRQPERFLVIGDAVCSFNPVYGQGMTVAALGAMALRECLCQCGHSSLSGLARRFQRKLARVNASPWALATAMDSRVPTVEGGSLKWTKKWQSAYLNRLLQILSTDPSISDIFVKVVHMVEDPISLFYPSIAIKVLFAKEKPTILMPAH